jgi:hypothetical protein
MESENSVKVKGNLYLCCTCGKHRKDSKCEVYLRKIGKWDQEVEAEKLLKEIIEWMRERENDNKIAEPYSPKYPFQPIKPPGNYCPKCGQFIYGNIFHMCSYPYIY